MTEFQKSITTAIALAESRVAAIPKDRRRRTTISAPPLGLNASYIASIEGRLLAGFRAASRAYDEHERVLRLDPSRKDAGLTVGTYRYIVSTLSAPLRLMAYVAGFGGGRERGIQMLQETAAAGGENRTDAMFALVLVYNRERRYDEALGRCRNCASCIPVTGLVLLESWLNSPAGGPARAGRGCPDRRPGDAGGDERAENSGRRNAVAIQAGRRASGARPRRRRRRPDLQSATSAEAQTWVRGRARVELARVALQRGDRSAAAGEARQAETFCQQGQDPVCLDEAKKLLRTSDGR